MIFKQDYCSHAGAALIPALYNVIFGAFHVGILYGKLSDLPVAVVGDQKASLYGQDLGHWVRYGSRYEENEALDFHFVDKDQAE